MAKQTFTVGQVLTAAQLTSLQQTAMLGGAASAKTASYTLVAADAGTTISMTSTSATTITVNTGLFAAGDTVFIQNLGTGNLTITAGTATVSTAGSLILPQNDAGILYFVSTGVSVFYDFIQVGAASPLTTKGDLYTFSTSDTRLGVGANGTTLVADSAEATGLKWSTPSSGALTFIAAETFSAVSSVSFNNVFTSTYRNYLVIIDWVGTANNSTKIRLRASGSDNTTSNYCTQRFIATNASIGAYRVTGTAWEIVDQTAQANGGYMYFFNPQTSNKTAGTFSGYSNGESAVDYMPGSNIFNATTSFDGFTFYPSSGTATGAIRVYGLANS